LAGHASAPEDLFTVDAKPSEAVIMVTSAFF
jgi:hypothetical protein